MQGAISLNEFRSNLPSLSTEQEIIFYCGWPNEGSAAGQAEKLLKDGYRNAAALGGGVEAWKNAGYPMIWKLWDKTKQLPDRAILLFMPQLGEYIENQQRDQ